MNQIVPHASHLQGPRFARAASWAKAEGGAFSECLFWLWSLQLKEPFFQRMPMDRYLLRCSIWFFKGVLLRSWAFSSVPAWLPNWLWPWIFLHSSKFFPLLLLTQPHGSNPQSQFDCSHAPHLLATQLVTSFVALETLPCPDVRKQVTHCESKTVDILTHRFPKESLIVLWRVSWEPWEPFPDVSFDLTRVASDSFAWPEGFWPAHLCGPPRRSLQTTRRMQGSRHRWREGLFTKRVGGIQHMRIFITWRLSSKP